MSASPEKSQAEENDTGTCAEPVVQILLDLPPSCIEFAPATIPPLPLRSCFVVGTYYLETGADRDENENGTEDGTTQKRNGSLIVYQLQEKSLLHLQTKKIPYAVLDLHFSSFEPNLFAVATSTGLVCINSLELDDDQIVRIRLIFSIKIADPSVLVLSLAWSPYFAHQSIIAVSLSDGSIGVFDSKINPCPIKLISAHSLEAWTVAWSLKSDKTVHPSLYSGGDDSAFCQHRERSPANEKSNNQAFTGDLWETVISDKRVHRAGITAILCLERDESTNSEVVLTGSYDEYIRVLICEASRRQPNILAEKNLGGGVWRLKLLGSGSCGGQVTYKILASCMHAGPMILEINRPDKDIWTISVIAYIKQHESMNYASDGREQVAERGGKRLVNVSTSFYDQKLCVWNLDV